MKYEVVTWVETSSGSMSDGYDQPLDPPEFCDSIPEAVKRVEALVFETGLAHRWRLVK